MDKVNYIRAEAVVYQRDGEKFKLLKNHATINDAKRFTRQKPLGEVARKETIIREHGEKFYNELIG